MIHLGAGNHKYVAWARGLNGHKRYGLFVLPYELTGQVPSNNLGKYTAHKQPPFPFARRVNKPPDPGATAHALAARPVVPAHVREFPNTPGPRRDKSPAFAVCQPAPPRMRQRASIRYTTPIPADKNWRPAWVPNQSGSCAHGQRPPHTANCRSSAHLGSPPHDRPAREYGLHPLEFVPRRR